ncbi:MAG: glycine cleavage system protein GcvH [Planctomycetota bacterium]
MDAPKDYRYTESHEWCKLDGETATVGLTRFAADQLTDITFVELPETGTTVTAGQSFGDIESVKSAGEMVAPISGEVVAVNEALNDNPGLINSDPFVDGWILKVKASNPAEIDALMDAEAYGAKVEAS